MCKYIWSKLLHNKRMFTINLEKFESEKPEIDDLGQTFAAILRQECVKRGYLFRFYSMSQEKNITYDVTVRGEMEETDHYKKQF